MLQRRAVRSPAGEQGCRLIVRLDMSRVFCKKFQIRSECVVQSAGPLSMLLIQAPEVETCIWKTRSKGDRFSEICRGPVELPVLRLDNSAEVKQARI